MRPFGNFISREESLVKGILTVSAMLSSFHAIPVELFSGVSIDQTASTENIMTLDGMFLSLKNYDLP
jgi:hypothetical protein